MIITDAASFVAVLASPGFWHVSSARPVRHSAGWACDDIRPKPLQVALIVS